MARITVPAPAGSGAQQSNTLTSQHQLSPAAAQTSAGPRDSTSSPIQAGGGDEQRNTGLIFADLLIPGRGEPTTYAALVYSLPGSTSIEDNNSCAAVSQASRQFRANSNPSSSDSSSSSILWIGKSRSLPAQYSHLRPTHVPVLMPGLWDCHVHLSGGSTFTIDDLVFLPPALAGARLSRDLATLLNAGYTSVRELMGYGYAVAQAVDEGWIPGPNIYSSVAILSTTAGHGDAHGVPLDVIRRQQENNGGGAAPLLLCDGVDECVKAVRTVVRQGAKVVKVAATGGVLSLIDDPKRQQFSDEELVAIVREAKRMGRVVAAHCHGKEGVLAALRAGCATIEHGTYMDEECLELMKEKKAMLVATRSIVVFGVDHPELMPPAIYRKMVETGKYHKQAYQGAIKAGVKIALGTDLGVSSEKVGHYFGMNGREIGFAVDAGMTELQAIEAATANAPDTLGDEMKPKSGQLEEGYEADFIALAESPLKDIQVLEKPELVTHVWKGGKLYKKPGHPVGFFPVVADSWDSLTCRISVAEKPIR